MSHDGDWKDLIPPGSDEHFDQIRKRPHGRIVVIWQRVEEGWRLTRVDADGRVGQATGTSRSDLITRARAAMRSPEDRN